MIERQVGRGTVILLSDEGMLRVNLDGDNGRFLGNLMAYALDRAADDFPEAVNDVAVGRVFRDFSLDFCANDTRGNGDLRLVEVNGRLPYNLTRQGCRISGVPTERSFGNHQLTYTVADADGDRATGYISITINGDGAAVGNPRCDGRLATIIGTPGDDRIVGTSGDDVIIAGNGRDFVDGKGGNDVICGGDGNDEIKGGNGADRLFGEGGKDRIGGGKGRPDLCNGGPAKDKRLKGCERRISM